MSAMTEWDVAFWVFIVVMNIYQAHDKPKHSLWYAILAAIAFSMGKQ